MALAPDFFDTRTRNWRARLAISTSFMRELSRYSDPQDLYRVFSRRMGQLFPTDRQVTLSRRGVSRPDVRVTRFNLWKETANPFTHWDRFPVLTGGLLADLLYADEPRLLPHLRVAHGDPAAEFLDGQGSLLSIPIFDHGAAVNTVILTREEPDAFRPEQVPELVWMCNLFGRATQSLVLSARLREAYESAEAELQAVAELQRGMLPASVPAVPGLEVAVHYRTAGRAGGDYYDFFPLPGGRLGVLVADVSGHGTPAAVLMAITHGIAHDPTAPLDRPGAFLAHLNDRLNGRAGREAGNFVTAFYGLFDPTAGRLSYASAGHVPPRLVRAADGGRVPLNMAQRLPLGVGPAGTEYPEAATGFGPGDRVALFTDGVADAMSAGGDVFGADHLDRVLSCGATTAGGLRDDLLAALEPFAAGPRDDRTLVVVGRA